MSIQIDKYDVLWTYLSRFLRIGQGVILLPLILKHLPTDQIAIWAIFSSIVALVAVFDLGFSNVFTRNSTQLLSDIDIECAEKESIEFTKLTFFMRKFYLYISAFLFLVLAVFGTLYIYKISNSVNDKFTIYLSWVVLLSSSIINFFYTYLTIILQAKGLIKETQKITVYGIMLSLIFATIGIYLGLGLIAITLSNFISVLYNRYFFYRIFHKEIKPFLCDRIIHFSFVEYFKEIWGTTYKITLSSISSIVNYRSGIFLVTLFLPLQQSGSFAFSMNFVFILSEVSFMFYYSHLPQINSMAYVGNTAGVRKVYLMSIVVSFITFLAGSLVLILAGNFVLKLIGSKMLLIGPLYLTIALVISFLDLIMNMSTSIHFAYNNIKYIWSYCISTIIILIISFIYCNISPSYFAVLLPMLFVQLSYNFWIWPKKLMTILMQSRNMLR